MLYMPTTTTTSPVVLQETFQPPLPSTSHYFMLQSAPVVPAVPVLNTTYVYPRYGFVPRPVETAVSKDEIEKFQSMQIFEAVQPIQHIVHHHVQPCSMKTCPGYCELCCPWIKDTTHQHCHTSLSNNENSQQKRYSRRDEYERDELYQNDPYSHETIDEKIERIRRELRQSSMLHGTSSGFERPRSRSNSRPRSASGTREPWRSSNQNDYQWRDSHLPAYREATLARAETPANESRTWKETAHERSHENTKNATSYHSKKEYVYRPKSETEARKWYTQTTGKDPDREVYQALRGGTTTYDYKGGASSGSCYNKHQSTTYANPCHSNAGTTTKTHSLRKIDSTQHHNLYACNQPCLHVIPKQGSAADPPYVKILNAPVTYLH
ncbi:unnamed protein product [Adineta steineri]|uniref:Uncharacterized protein n=1 Tax=Adineta steineri TaxID=433720 RepID=A0A814U2E8_9BILA|nr:unnamed protein product [Adineta steineri]CAF1169191.1 unnamed protein product [Adineta steineri]CAF3523736.1 unnamed protein product [Adineta steineri]CAF3766062.1 unnamed protein product [Adineta steineri]